MFARVLLCCYSYSNFFKITYIIFIFSYFFFFSSRRRHTRSKRDWSSDVCSSDLELGSVRAPMPGLIPEDEPIVAEAQAMIEAAIAKL